MKNRTKLWLVVLISVISSLLLFVLSSLIVGRFWNAGYNLEKLNAISGEALHSIEQQGAFGKDRVGPLLESVHEQHPAIRLEWIASDGAVIHDTSGEAQRYDFGQLASRVANMPNNLWIEHELVAIVYPLNLNGQPYYLLLSLPNEAMKGGQLFFKARTFSVLYTLILPILLAAAVPYFLSLWFFSSINRRLSKLNNALNQVNFRSDAILLEDRSKDEIGKLTRHYNQMAERIRNQASQIEQFENRRKLLLSNLSHDLRTPLTMILGYAETIRTGSFNDESELQASAKIILQRSRYMDKLLDQLLNISRQDSESMEIRLVMNNLSELMRKIVADYLLLLDDQSYTVEVDIPEQDVIVRIDAALIERALRNLLDNAIRHGGVGRYLGIQLVEKEDDLIMIVEDHGKGIVPEDRERIFDRFYRSGGRRRGEGLGIGLAIVKDIVDLHRGHIQVSSTPDAGTVFQLHLPKLSR